MLTIVLAQTVCIAPYDGSSCRIRVLARCHTPYLRIPLSPRIQERYFSRSFPSFLDNEKYSVTGIQTIATKFACIGGRIFLSPLPRQFCCNYVAVRTHVSTGSISWEVRPSTGFIGTDGSGYGPPPPPPEGRDERVESLIGLSITHHAVDQTGGTGQWPASCCLPTYLVTYVTVCAHRCHTWS